MSKRSARHRVKRNQQLIEAQRLLESHSLDTKPEKTLVQNLSGEKDNLVFERNDQYESSISTRRIIGDSLMDNELFKRTKAVKKSSNFKDFGDRNDASYMSLSQPYRDTSNKTDFNLDNPRYLMSKGKGEGANAQYNQNNM